MKTRPTWIAALAVLAACATFASAAGATTVTRHQNPHYRVTVSLTPTQVAVGSRLTVTLTVTNTTSKTRHVSIGYGFEGPSSGEGSSMSPIALQPHTSWTTSFRRRAALAGRYSANVTAHDAAGTSHARATATAG